jgi:hypothetical protein
MRYKYASSDCYEHISLHDNIINKIILEKKRHDTKNIALIFDEGFDVVKTHFLNDTGKSKHTSSSRIDLVNAHFLYGEVYCHNQEKQQIDIALLLDESSEFEVLEVHREENNLKLMGIIKTAEFKNEFAALSFSCDEVIFSWNDYSSDAWFEGWPESTN